MCSCSEEIHSCIIIFLSYVITGQPLADPTTTTGVTSRVSIVTGCEDDGDDTCRTDLRVETDFLHSG